MKNTVDHVKQAENYLWKENPICNMFFKKSRIFAWNNFTSFTELNEKQNKKKKHLA